MPEKCPKRPVDRRTAMKTLAGAGLLALGSRHLHASEEHASDPLAAILPGLRDASRRRLQAVLAAPGFRGQIPAGAVADLLAGERKPAAELMLALLPLARRYSHPPISNYRVGVVARGESGSFYLGFNLEVPGQALGFAVHGEQAALSGAYMHGEHGVTSIALTAAPCGHCRQFMEEMAPDGQIEIVVEGAAPAKLATLLPAAFGPRDLGRKEGALPVRETKLVLAAPASDAVVQAALAAAQSSYAPYSGAHSGVAIGTRSRRIYRGAYIENVAFNPSLSPLQTALVQMIVAGEEYGAIARVVLVEIGGAKISQRNASEAVLSAVAPEVRVELWRSARGGVGESPS